MTNTKQKKRAKVIGVTVELEDPKGNRKTVKIDPKVTKALFWDDKSVKDILAPFYKKKKTKMSKKDFIGRFGTIGKKIAGSQNEVEVTEDVIKKLWEEEDENGDSLALLSKTFMCLPEPPPPPEGGG